MSKWLSFARMMYLGDTTCILPPSWQKKHNAKTALINGTQREPEMDVLDLSKHAKKTNKKQKFVCLNDTDELKRNWSEYNYIKLSTRSAQPHRKSGKCNDMHSFVEGVATSH